MICNPINYYLLWMKPTKVEGVRTMRQIFYSFRLLQMS